MRPFPPSHIRLHIVFNNIQNPHHPIKTFHNVPHNPSELAILECALLVNKDKHVG